MKEKNRPSPTRPLGLFAQRLLIACAVGIGFCSFSMAAGSDDDNLNRLESKFFQHSYAKETMDARLGRIEKMVFGEAKAGSGSDQERLAKILTAVPLESPEAPAPKSDTASSSGGSGSSGGSAGKHSSGGSSSASDRTADADADSEPSDAKYPAVTAIEQKMFGKNYASEPVSKRLARLETKVYGKPSSSSDLTERTDALKASTGVDITRQSIAGSDWSDDEDNIMIPTAKNSSRGSYGGGSGGPPVSMSEGGKTFSGRDLGSELNKAFGRGGSSLSSSSAGFGSSSGSYGSGSSRSSAKSDSGDPDADLDSFPTLSQGTPASPMPNQFGSMGGASKMPITRTAPGLEGSGGMGLSQSVSALEQEVFSRTYTKDGIPARLSRLEEAVFPKEKPSTDKPLPDRVNRLLATIPISNESTRQVAEDNSMMNGMNGMNGAQQKPGGLGKIINNIGKMMNGGYQGGYPMSGGALVTDPSTGMLIDPTTGNLIDPNSGMVIGRRAVSPGIGGFGGMGGMSSMGGMGMGGLNMGGLNVNGMGAPLNGFNNGFSPYGMGGMGSGLRFGGSPMGGIGSFGGGMWP